MVAFLFHSKYSNNIHNIILYHQNNISAWLLYLFVLRLLLLFIYKRIIITSNSDDEVDDKYNGDAW